MDDSSNLDPVPATALVRARSQLHVLAERVLAPDLRRVTGRIGLRVTPGGIGQPEHLVDGRRRRVRVDGAHLVVDLDGDGEQWHELTTLGAALELLDLPVGAGPEVYAPETPDDPELDVAVEPEAAADLAAWFRFVEDALEVVRRRHADRRPAIVQLWPEHFDLACSLAEVNLGGSPGDAGDSGRSEPYLYVGPWTPPAVGGFWNEPYGAALARSDVRSVADAVAFFEEGLSRVTG